MILTTPRLALREATRDDAPFMNRLLNEPSWRRNIGQHEVDSDDAAARYLAERYLPAYAAGFGLWVVARRKTLTAVGVCGLVDRPWLDDLDLGFALLECCWGRGYAYEAASAVVAWAASALAVTRLAAVTAAHNAASIALLEKLGFAFAGEVVPPGEKQPLLLYRLTGLTPEAAR